ncbi:hypothetical protein M3Y98_00722000 [Aphelenchoides besseyi]|nr:hypothetical protein M3Y98_00720300 [Aphelenchoides besseyi]KAI6180458.1 hypothetical protein M3Y98_00722000 [Aphelenchoides besseyi]KAI6210228.1 hypothetical protein M3Y96_00305600 [Aphelenchoides besseyi]
MNSRCWLIAETDKAPSDIKWILKRKHFGKQSTLRNEEHPTDRLLPFVYAFDVPFTNYTHKIKGLDYVTQSYLTVNISVGTPAQTIPVIVSPLPTDDQPASHSDLVVLGKAQGHRHFICNESKSLQIQDASYSFYEPYGPTGWIASDNVTIGNKESNKNQNFRILLNSTAKFSTLHLNLPTQPNPSFIRDLLKNQREQVVTFSYNSVPSGYAGLMSVGDRAPKRCKNDWITMRQAVGPYQWMIEFDEITVGKYTQDLSDKVTALITVDNDYMVLPRKLIVEICNNLNTQNCYFDSFIIDCGTKQNISFKIMGKQLMLTPADYLYHGKHNCAVKMAESKDYKIFLPNSLLRTNCLLLDYANFQVGLASRINN